ncbi:MAG: hypothetical protein QN152_09475 [Armatimonadota bacterium]|nr:hypothetical protein [Armatimonadota bacterium]MDR7428455.1 hypothetical protein [Armatimonadota bacterium]MDR7463425.1 hypothetical protein [Armatimonadota bacterium]MDR7470204.1 hypothetical protein [Armatimonadota bacterium]MDR7476065.1 hypothetical protein [Armatimonadota bacterium]
MIGLRAALPAVLVVVVAGAPAPAPSAAAVLELVDVGHALREQTLVITGGVRNTGALPAGGLVIDASGFAASGDLAAFGSDGIPWTLAPGAAEPFQIFLPLGRSLVSRYTVTVSGSRPRQARPAALSRTIPPAFYRSLILPRVGVDVDAEPTALTFTAAAKGLPVTAVRVTVTLLVRDRDGLTLRALNVEVPVDRPLRLRFAPLIVRVVSVTVADVVLTSTWTLP